MAFQKAILFFFKRSPESNGSRVSPRQKSRQPPDKIHTSAFGSKRFKMKIIECLREILLGRTAANYVRKESGPGLLVGFIFSSWPQEQPDPGCCELVR